MVELLRVTDAFQLSNVGLALSPDFPVPTAGWQNVSAAVELITPEGQRIASEARFNLTHFNFSGASVGAERRWRVVVSLPELHKARVPVGTRLLVPTELKARLVPAGGGA
jgi:hypothetical protein